MAMPQPRLIRRLRARSQPACQQSHEHNPSQKVSRFSLHRHPSVLTPFYHLRGRGSQRSRLNQSREFAEEARKPKHFRELPTYVNSKEKGPAVCRRPLFECARFAVYLTVSTKLVECKVAVTPLLDCAVTVTV
jgi:hypothetical protein